MARYRFHCTNGRECVFDAVGNDIRAPHRLLRRAEAVAREVMRSLGEQGDWAEWHVTVHDLRGRRVLVRPFLSVEPPAQGRDRPGRTAQRARFRDGDGLGQAA
ncbi:MULTISPECIES: hypothetical protein [unclassified Methylobacterium]|jgi:hypothetical protein|uniref:DUF6894 family protein n=1 Tax=unclassified Methylobacterium TaxID=2615210 RepID=UPI000B28B5D7|nr:MULTISPECIES: hypothetical protein [unclassified Methylobacterium]